MSEPTTVTPEEVPLERLAKMYVKMRDKIQDLTRIYEAEVEGIKAQRDLVANAMKDRVLAMGGGISSVKTEHGTIMLRTATRYYAQDWESFGKFVIEQADINLMEKRIAQGNMGEYLKAHPDVSVPGLSSMSEIEVTVRRPTATK
jgi:hypothetical protein